MKKKILHLVCNSHLDPVWQWDWDEGASAALSTFYAACNLLDEYDFVFCHNEVLLYEYIEKYDQELFKRIQDLVNKGKWKIMGGWYIQPDCMVPSGESFIRQISLGREYFKTKFNARPTCAINFDAFAHTRGLADILASTGYESYCFCRPMPYHLSNTNEAIPHGPFIWKGYSNKKIKAIRIEAQHIYCSELGQAKNGIIEKESKYDDLSIMPILWGVGNHGGVSSKQDLEDIMVLQNEKKGEWEIIHSTLEDYFKEVEPDKVYDKQMICFIKSYSSCHPIKLAHDQLENALYLTEKICTISELNGVNKYNKDVLKNAERTLCQIEFHDVLSGTAIKTGTDSSIRKAYKAIEELKVEFFKAFHSISKNLPKVTPNDDNLVVLNPFPYIYKGYIEGEIFLNKGNTDPKLSYEFKIYDQNNKEIEYQIIKEESELNLERRVRFLFKVDVPSFSTCSYGIHSYFVDKKEKFVDENNDIIYHDDVKSIKINRKTGLIDSFIVNNIERIKSHSFLPMTFDDDEDPWGWWTYSLENNLKPFKIDQSSKGVYQGLKGVTVVEKGNLLTEVQAKFSKGESHIIINYRIFKNTNYIDVNVHVLFNEHMKGLKIKLPLNGSNKYFAQSAFGQEIYEANGKEYPCNRYVGVKYKDDCFVIYNKSGIHSVSKNKKNLYLTLLNGSVYCAHPVGEKGKTPILPDPTRYVKYIEQGISDFSFRIAVNKLEECEKFSNEFNQPPYTLLYFPHGDGKCEQNPINLSNNNIVITALKRLNNGSYLIRLYNGFKGSTSTNLLIKKINKNIKFKKFEFKSFVFDYKSIKEVKDASIY